MAKRITFTDKGEAKEYISRMMRAGYNVGVQKIGNKYIVNVGTLLGTKIMAGVLRFKDEEPEIVYAKRPSTTTRLHEMGHIAKGHPGGERSDEEFTKQELEAEMYAYRKMGRKITARTLGRIAHCLMYERFLTGEEANDMITNELRRQGIIIDPEEKRKFNEKYNWETM